MNKEGLKECVHSLHNQKSTGVKEMYKKTIRYWDFKGTVDEI